MGAVVTFSEITEHQRKQEALRSALAEIEQLTGRLQTENLYLREEIKVSHNFEEMIGQSTPAIAPVARELGITRQAVYDRVKKAKCRLPPILEAKAPNCEMGATTQPLPGRGSRPIRRRLRQRRHRRHARPHREHFEVLSLPAPGGSRSYSCDPRAAFRDEGESANVYGEQPKWE